MQARFGQAAVIESAIGLLGFLSVSDRWLRIVRDSKFYFRSNGLAQVMWADLLRSQ